MSIRASQDVQNVCWKSVTSTAGFAAKSTAVGGVGSQRSNKVVQGAAITDLEAARKILEL